MSTLKIGWIGSGFVGQVGHLNLYEDISIANIVALAELRKNLAARVQKKHDIKKFYNNYLQMLDQEELDGVVLIVHRNDTAYHAKNILLRKKNLFTEKPQASTYKQAKILVDIAKKNNLIYCSGLMRRHDEGIKYVKNIVQNKLLHGKLGNIIGADFFCHAGGDYCNIGNYVKTKEPRIINNLSKSYPEWLSKSVRKYYEEFLNTNIHTIDLIRYVLGSDLIIKNVNYNKYKLSNITFENRNKYLINFKWRKIDKNHWHEGFTIYFEKGYIFVELRPAFLRNVNASIKIYSFGNSGILEEKKLKNISSKWSFYNQHIDFLKSIKFKKKPISSCSDSLNSIKSVEEIFKKII